MDILHILAFPPSWERGRCRGPQGRERPSVISSNALTNAQSCKELEMALVIVMLVMLMLGLLLELVPGL